MLSSIGEIRSYGLNILTLNLNSFGSEPPFYLAWGIKLLAERQRLLRSIDLYPESL